MMKFEDIQYAPLRAYNRCVMLFNIREDEGEEASQKYAAQFTKPELAEMLDVYNIGKKIGFEELKRLITRAMPLQNPDDGEVFE